MAATRYVYLIKKGDLHKIGFSKNPLARAQTTTKKGRLGEVVHHFPCRQARLIESHLHLVFTDKRRYGEWFALDPADVELICSVTSCDSVADLPPELQQVKGEPKKKQWGTSDGRNGTFIELPPELVARLDALKEQTGRSRNAEIVRAITRHLLYPEPLPAPAPMPPEPIPQRAEPPPPRPQGRPRKKSSPTA